jgi:thiaminase/transcriptional activator TenA
MLGGDEMGIWEKNFTESLWNSIEDIYGKILKHPFVMGLSDGSLNETAFRFYVIQDALYLRDFARGLAMLGAKAPEDKWLMMFAEHARDTVVVERALHESFLTEWGLSIDDIQRTPMAPNNLLYTSYLLRVAHERPFHEGLGAYLPCYWIYWKVGKELERRGSRSSLFQRWIETYASDQFGTIVEEVLTVVNTVADRLDSEQRERVREHFITTTKLEYLFWDMGFQMQDWIV